MQNIVYECIRRCTWDKRRWDVGAQTSPLPPNIKPPYHFVPVNELINEQKEQDEENDQFTMGEYTDKIINANNTSEGMLAEDDLHSKRYLALKKIAKDMGIDCEELNTKEKLIEAIENHDKQETE